MATQLAERSIHSAGRLAGESPSRQSILGRLQGALAASFVRSGQRRALRELAQDGRLLSDIGLNRDQALREAAKPFWQQ